MTGGFCALLLATGALTSSEKTFYTYSSQGISIPSTSGKAFNLETIQAIDLELLEQIKPLSSSRASLDRVRAYLYSAASDFATLLSQLGERGKGDLEALSNEVARIFFPVLPQKPYRDLLSLQIGNQVVQAYEARYLAEEKKLEASDVKQGELYWKPKGPPYGLYIGSLTSWYIESPKAFPYASPPTFGSPLWEEQVQAVKAALKGLTEEKQVRVIYWAKEGDWQTFLKEAALQAGLDPVAYLYQRAILQRTLSDALSVAFYEKYRTGGKRPTELSKEIIPYIPPPNHPSYPSGHSTTAGAAKMILSTFYPEAHTRWTTLAEEAGQSRINAGLHFPHDHEEGMRLGELVGQKALREEHLP